MKVNKLTCLLFIVLISCQLKEEDGYDNFENYIQIQNPEGTSWQMDYSMEIHEDTTFRHVPKHWLRIKTFTNNRFVFTGYDFDKKEIAGMGGGTYSLEDSTYVEHIEFHHRSDFNGTEFEGRLYFDSLYLYQTGKVGELTLRERWHRID